jgi:sugar transferase (PEP-CTERM/EpsH1 system associated)
MSHLMKTDEQIVAHLIYQLDVGGLERVMLNCIHNMQQTSNYRHVIISLTTANSFSQSELARPIDIFVLNKSAGNDFSLHSKLYRLLKQLKPDILHTYNLAAIEYHPIAWLAGVKGHIHAEHGRDIHDPQGLNVKHKWLRRLASPFIQYFIPVSQDLQKWLIDFVGIPDKKVKLIRNGINTDKFQTVKKPDECLRLAIIARLTPVKDHKNLIDAFSHLTHSLDAEQMPRLRVIGSGPLEQELKSYVENKGLNYCIKFLGERHDIVELLSEVDVFVLSSIAEGIPMTILEAMSCGIPVVATRVGGIPEVIEDRRNGRLVDKQNPEQLANALLEYIQQPHIVEVESISARERIVNHFSEIQMVEQYLACYDQLNNKGKM